MPTHSKSKSHTEGGAGGARPKSTPTSSARAGGAGSGRSAVTGQKLGKAARRALEKNGDNVDDLLDVLMGSKTFAEMAASLRHHALTLGRVERSTGAGRLDVTVLDILSCTTTDVSLPISGNLKFKGRSQTKTDRANCMIAGDVIVVRGAFASGKMSAAAANDAQEALIRWGLEAPRSFFSSRAEVAAAVAEAAEEGVGGFVFDRTEQRLTERAEMAALRAEGARARALRTGGAAAVVDDDGPVNIDAI